MTLLQAQSYPGRNLIPSRDFPQTISSVEELDEVIMTRLRHLGGSSQTDSMRIAFAIIHHARLTPTVLKVLRKKYLPSFSMIKWDDISPYFIRSLDMTLYDDHRSIRPYILKRSRIPLDVFKTLCEQLDRSPITLGERRDLENEAAVQLYIHPIPTTLLGMFHGRLTYLPQHPLNGQISGSGRCEFTVSFGGRLVLLFIECKHELPSGPIAHSNLVAQLMAEADGVDTWNQTKEFDGVPIHAILTDGINYEFYILNFNEWSVLRGVGTAEEGMACNMDRRLTISLSERSPDYLARLKTVVEVIFDTLMESFIVALEAQRSQELAVGIFLRGTEIQTFWDPALLKAQEALAYLRAAHRQRAASPLEAEETSRTGLRLLNESALLIPKENLDWSLTDNWEQRSMALLQA